MDTMMLRAIQHPAHTDDLLRELVRSIDVVPIAAHEIFDSSVVPSALQEPIKSAEKARKSWSAWVDDAGLAWLFVAQMLLEVSRQHGAPVLEVTQYREGGEVTAAGIWIALHEGEWVPFCNVILPDSSR
jgi:hypothetical protein